MIFQSQNLTGKSGPQDLVLMSNRRCLHCNKLVWGSGVCVGGGGGEGAFSGEGRFCVSLGTPPEYRGRPRTRLKRQRGGGRGTFRPLAVKWSPRGRFYRWGTIWDTTLTAQRGKLRQSGSILFWGLDQPLPGRRDTLNAQTT